MKFLADKNLTLHDATNGKKLRDLMVSFSRFDAVSDDDDDPLPHDTIIVNANKYARVQGRSLIDGGANETLCGSDMKLIMPRIILSAFWVLQIISLMTTKSAHSLAWLKVISVVFLFV